MKKLLLVAALSVATTSVFAQASASDNKKFYFGAEIGSTKVDNNAQTFANLLVRTNGGSASVTQNSSVGTGRIFGGYTLNENVDLEVGYIQSGDIDYKFAGSNSSGSYSGTTSVSVSGIDYSVLLRPSKASGYNNAYLRVGGTSYKTKIQTTGVNVTGGNGSESGMGYVYGAGYDLNVAKEIDVRFQINRLEKIAGVSDDKATVFSVGILGKF
jgi:hypothetical protein